MDSAFNNPLNISTPQPFNMKNWKTTIGGLIALAGATLSATSNGTHQALGQVLTGLGALILGLSAKDKNVTGGTTQQ